MIPGDIQLSMSEVKVKGQTFSHTLRKVALVFHKHLLFHNTFDIFVLLHR